MMRRAPNALVGCERFGVVRDALRRRGFNAYSCDLHADANGSAFHIIDDVRRVMAGDVMVPDALGLMHHIDYWDLFIVHPDCTYLTNAGVWAFTRTPPNPSPHVLYGRKRFQAMHAACGFFRECLDAPIRRVCVENPVMHGYALAEVGPHSQTIQPYQFGDNASKRTCLWLKNIPRLVIPHESEWIAPRIVNGKKRWGNQTDSGQNKLTPSPTRAMDRAKTYPGIADAFAQQWFGVAI